MRLKIGSHVSINNGLINAIHQQIKMKGNVIQVFLRSPRGGRHASTSITTDVIAASKTILEKNKITFVCHAPYVLNLCNANSKENRWIINILQDDMRLSHNIGGIGAIVHVGKSIRLPSDVDAVDEMEKAVRTTLTDSIGTVILETCCGQGTELLHKLEDFAEFYSRFSKEEHKRFKLCIDTCHVFAAGEYNLGTLSGMKQYFHDFEQLIGIENLAVIHLNDSKTEFGSRVDRHENLWRGKIWSKDNDKSLDLLIEIAKKHNIPLVLETPKEGHEYEIGKFVVP